MKKIIIFLVFSLVTYFCFFIKNQSRPEGECKAEISFIKGNERMNIVSFQNLDSGQGTISISGVLYNGKKISGYLSKTVNFTYKKNGDNYLVRSDLILNSPQMTLTPDVEKRWLPDFFITKGQSLLWKIKHLNNRSWLVYSETVPLYLREKNQ